MTGFHILDLVKPFSPFIPEVIAPQRKTPFKQKFMWTAVILLIFLIMSEIPLYGIGNTEGDDPLVWLRMMLASNRGSLMELGISPIVSSGMIFQLIQGTKMIHVDSSNKQDRESFQTAQKMFAFLLSFGQATVYVLTGMYGPPSSLGVGLCLLLILQLVFASILVILLDELLQKGYGLGSGISLFTTTNVCEQLFWRAFSPTTINTGKGNEFEGAVVSFFHLLYSRDNKLGALYQAFYRKNLPNVSQLISTVGLFFLVVYLQGFKIDLPIRFTKQRGPYSFFPIKLFHTSNVPIMLQSALSSNIFIFSQILYTKWPSNFFVRVLGVWDAKSVYHTLSASGGLSYFIQPPDSFREFIDFPLKSFIYIFYVLTSCAVFSKTWIEVSGSSPDDITRQFKDQGIVILGHKDSSNYRELKKIIPIAAAFGGASIGALSVISDLFGTLGSNTSIFLAVTTIYGYYEIAAKESGFDKDIVSGYSDGI